MHTTQTYHTAISYLKFITFFLIAFCYYSAFAEDDPIGKQLCAVVTALSGTTAKAIAIIALMFVGVGLFMGKVNWGVATATALGIIVLFGAPTLVGFLGGGSLDGSTCVTTNS
jgi:type IV secretory pathway VirB2 component (pilin)